MKMEKINIIGVYDDPDQLIQGVRKIKENGFNIKNVFSPFPIHEIWDDMKLKTRLPLITFFYGVFGAAATFGFLYWTSVVNYPLKFGGKPLNSLSFIIIMFVVTILIANFLIFMTFFIRQKIGPGKKAVLIDKRSVDDKFVIVIEKDPALSADDITKINSLMKENGAVEVKEEVEPADFNEERDE
jgi:hypothetical protein